VCETLHSKDQRGGVKDQKKPKEEVQKTGKKQEAIGGGVNSGLFMKETRPVEEECLEEEFSH